MTQEAARTQDLESAFQLFNRLSSELASSYRALQERVCSLNAELTAARDGRLSELAERERLAERLGRLLAALPAGVVEIDAAGAVQDHNAAAAALLGEGLRGRPWREIAARAFTPLDDAQEFGLHDGRRVHVQSSALGADNGQIVLINDVTQTRRLQEHLSRHQRLSALGEMAASLAHQFRTPLATALLYIGQLMNAADGASAQQRIAGKVHASLLSLERLVNDMLLFARGGGSTKEEILLPELYDQLEQALESVLASVGCTLERETPLPAIVLYGNREALLGALQNLAVNASQACGAGGRLRLAAAVLDAGAQGACIDLTLSDNGPGIAPELHARVFEPFFTTRAQGTGLGLAVVQAVARAHGGEAWLRSRPGEGSTFGLRLPLTQAHVALHSGFQPCATH